MESFGTPGSPGIILPSKERTQGPWLGLWNVMSLPLQEMYKEIGERQRWMPAVVLCQALNRKNTDKCLTRCCLSNTSNLVPVNLFQGLS